MPRIDEDWRSSVTPEVANAMRIVIRLREELAAAEATLRRLIGEPVETDEDAE
jgi:Arc/MetJ family transcription regulator